MPPEQNYPSPTAAQVSSGAGPFFGQQNNANNENGNSQIPSNLQQLQQSVDNMRHNNAMALHQQSQDSMTGNEHDHYEHAQHALDESLRVDEALRQPTSPERLAQSVMNMSGDQSGFAQHAHIQPGPPGSGMMSGPPGGMVGSPDGTTPKVKRTKVSRACDECRRKKIRCDASETSDDPCSSCKRTGAPCRFSRQPMKRGPSKGYIKELADRLNTLESQLGPHHAAAAATVSTQHAAQDAYHGLGGLADLSEMSQDFGSPGLPQGVGVQMDQQQPGQISRKRTHSESEQAWARDQSGYAPARAAANAWAESAKFLSNPYTSGGMQPQPPQGMQGDAKQVPSMGRGESWRHSLEDGRRQTLTLPFETEPGEADTGVQVDWDDAVVDEYYRLIHQTFPLLPNSKDRLRTKLANCPPTLREAFLVALDCALRTSPYTHLQANPDPRQTTKHASELLLACQYEGATTGTLLSSLVYIQTLVLMAVESDNQGPATVRGQSGPLRSEWLGRAIGMATHLKLNVPRLGQRYGEGDVDADEKLGRRIWWVLFILDRWHSSSTSSMMQIPEASCSLLPEDLMLLGESTYHIARLSFILGHLTVILQQTPSVMSPASPASSIINAVISGELARFRETVEPMLLASTSSSITVNPNTNTTLISLAYWHVRLLILRLLPTSTPSELFTPAARMAGLLESPLAGTPTPLNHHFTALAALTLVELCGFDETKTLAEQGLREIEEGLSGHRVVDGSSIGWDAAIRVLIAKGPAEDINASSHGAGTGTAGLQHLADAAISGKGGNTDGPDTTSPEGAAAAAAVAAAVAAGVADGSGGVDGDVLDEEEGDETGVGVDVDVDVDVGDGGVGVGVGVGGSSVEGFDPTMLARFGYLSALAQE